MVSCDWSPDGQLLALGLYNGKVLLRDKTGQELFSIEKPNTPIWCLAFCPQKFDTSDNSLIIGAWNQKLSLYTISGGKNFKQVGNDKELGFDPLSISFYPNGNYMVISGSDKKTSLWNKDGVHLGTINSMNDWVWSTAVNPVNNKIFSGANDGEI